MGPRQRARVLPRRFDVCSVVHQLATFVLLLQVRQGASENEFEWSCCPAHSTCTS